MFRPIWLYVLFLIPRVNSETTFLSACSAVHKKCCAISGSFIFELLDFRICYKSGPCNNSIADIPIPVYAFPR
ncbi:hypothetical protein V8F06_007670 [Rhypophila decipiens]